MTYNELLQQKEWWSKCNEILSRDHYTCKDCGCLGFHNGGNYMKLNQVEEIDTLFKGWSFRSMSFSKFWADIPYSKPYPFKGIEFEMEYENDGVNVYELDLFESPNKLFDDFISIPEKLITVTRKKIECLDANVYELGDISRKDNSLDAVGWAYLFEFPCDISNEIYVNIEYSLPFIIGDSIFERNIINITHNNRLLSLRYWPSTFQLKGLNIHHTYYIKGYKPWEYDNEALVTLCEDCHKKRHETSDVPLYDSNKRLISNLVRCDRCGGSGYLPQYSHVEHGRCFKCGGEGVVIRE